MYSLGYVYLKPPKQSFSRPPNPRNSGIAGVFPGHHLMQLHARVPAGAFAIAFVVEVSLFCFEAGALNPYRSLKSTVVQKTNIAT